MRIKAEKKRSCLAKSAKAEPLKYLIMIKHDTVVILNPEPC